MSLNNRKEQAAKRHREVTTAFKNWKTDIAKDIHGGVLDLLENGIMTDITLVVEEKEFRCHRLILAAVSPYFRSMFSGGFREENEKKIHLKEISAESFDVVLDYIYSKSNNIGSENVVDILKTAHMLQIKRLEIECERFVLDHLSDENAVDILKMATSMSWENLEEKARKYVLKNFLKISEGTGFLPLGVQEMTNLISCDEINSPAEEHVFHAVVDWMKYDKKGRQPLIADVLQHVRFPLMATGSLIEIKTKNRDIFEDRKCEALWEEACQYHMNTGRRHEMWSKRTQHRACSPYINVLIAVCGIETGAEIFAYDFAKKLWKEIKHIKCNFIPYNEFYNVLNVSANGDHIFCTIENKSKASIWDFGLLKRRLKTTEIQEYRKNGSTAVVGNSLIFIGGTSSRLQNDLSICQDVMKYDLSKGIEKGQECIGDILFPVQDMSTAVIGSKIYLFGGKMQSVNESSVVQCFDTVTKQCVIIGHLPGQPISCSTSVNVDDTVYVFSKSGTVIEVKFFPEYSARICGKFENFDFEKFSVVFRDGNFWIFNYCLGTKENRNRGNRATQRQIDPTTSNWVRVMQRETGQEIHVKSTDLPPQIPKVEHIMHFSMPKEYLK